MGGKGTPGHGTFKVNAGRSRRQLRLVAATALLAAGLTFGAAPVIGDGLNQKPAPASPITPATVLASVPQSVAAGQFPAAGLAAAAAESGNGAGTSSLRKMVLKSRITKEPVVTEEGKGTFAGISCPKGYKAISGGVISGYINLVISSSSPNNPLSGKYTPQTWWLTVTNANVDGQGGSLSWRGVVNCLAPVALGK